RRSIVRTKWAEEQLREAHDELERKVQERTADLKTANDSLRELSSRLQQMRDEERRQIARELHDSVGQLLAALSMNIAVVQRQSNQLDSAGARAVSENAAMVEQISREIRTISHLLHPPLLDAAGLASALRWYVDGFSERSKIKVDVDIPEEFGRLSDEMEIAIFRMVQECLTNIHRHSGGAAATIRVREEDHRLRVEIQDQGKGIPQEKQVELSSSARTGVGFRGMRERLRQLGGILEIQSDGTGTAVIATLPLQPSVAGGEQESRTTGT
ncbi:MAG: sensor histidine kinase, partial [Candidatus Sulfotelmatobacter sp.]